MSRIYHIGITNITSVPHWFHIGAPRAIFVFHIIITSISHQHHNTIISTSHRYHIIITSISHPYHNNFTSIAHQYHNDITTVAYQYHTKFTTISRRHHIRITSITSVSHWFHIGAPQAFFFPRDVPGRPRIRHARRPASRGAPQAIFFHGTSRDVPGSATRDVPQASRSSTYRILPPRASPAGNRSRKKLCRAGSRNFSLEKLGVFVHFFWW